MKKIVSKIISLSHVSVLGGHLQFGLAYGPDQMWSRQGRYSRFAIAIGPVTFESYANSKSVNQFGVKLNGTTHEIEIKFAWKMIQHNYRKLENGNSNCKNNLLYSWT
tara:strand:- start:358 stop:678 length:321 start_codon:yes stop_codon:yes gene_type:complete